MGHSGISFLTPLYDASSARSYGGKSVRLARLHSDSHMVARGFVISAQVYQMHLLQCGIKSSGAELEPQELSRRILQTPLSDESASLIQNAYRTLGMHVGSKLPSVMVRPSPVETDRNAKPERRIYRHAGPVNGSDELLDAIKRVWASVWSEEAVAQRELISDKREPSMAVIVQDYIRCDVVGKVMTADTISGKSELCRLIYFDPQTPEQKHTAVYRLDMMEFESDSNEGADTGVLSTAIDKGIMLEELFAEPVYVEWGWDGKWLWIFQCDPLRPAPTVSIDPSEFDFNRPYNLLGNRPIPDLCLPIDSAEKYPFGFLKTAGIAGDIYAAEGYIYRPTVGELSPEKFDHAIPAATAKLREYLDTDLYRRNPIKLSDKLLQHEIYDGLQNLRLVQGWMCAATTVSYYLRDALYDALEEAGSTDLLADLLGGIDSPFVVRDAKIQDFGLRFAEAGRNALRENADWQEGFRAEIEAFIAEYVYSFTSPLEYYDLSMWLSWQEEPNQLYNLINCAARAEARPGIPTLQTDAVQRYTDALNSLPEVLPAALLKQFGQTLESARTWIFARYQLEQRLVYAADILRQLLKEAWRRIFDGEIQESWRNIFELELDTLHSIFELRPEARRAETRSAVSLAKHRRWLRSRLVAPSMIGMELEMVAAEAEAARRVQFAEATRGRVRGGLRPVHSYADLSKIGQEDILVVQYPSLAWSLAAYSAAGIVSEQLPDVPSEALLHSMRDTPALFGSLIPLLPIFGGKRVKLDAGKKRLTGI